MMDLGHEVYHLRRDFRLWYGNLKRALKIKRPQLTVQEGDYFFMPATSADLKEIEELFFKLTGMRMIGWLHRVYKYAAARLITVVRDKNNAIVGYDIFMFQEMEWDENIIHGLYLGLSPKITEIGLAAKLRNYSVEVYKRCGFKGVSTLAVEGDVATLRTMQHAGFAITKASAKPPGYYLYRALSNPDTQKDK